METSIALPVQGDGAARLDADLILPARPIGIVLLVHGSGSSRLSPRNRFVARTLSEHGLATALIDIATHEEKGRSENVREPPRLSIDEMARRIEVAIGALGRDGRTAGLSLGLMGSGSGAAAAFLAASRAQEAVKALVSRGGRLEFASECLPRVRAPALLIVGSRDVSVVHHNREALNCLGSAIKHLEVIPGAHHLFEEPGSLATVALHAASWLAFHLPQFPRQAVVLGGQ